jgi:hypothetical protein
MSDINRAVSLVPPTERRISGRRGRALGCMREQQPTSSFLGIGNKCERCVLAVACLSDRRLSAN